MRDASLVVTAAIIAVVAIAAGLVGTLIFNLTH